MEMPFLGGCVGVVELFCGWKCGSKPHTGRTSQTRRCPPTMRMLSVCVFFCVGECEAYTMKGVLQRYYKPVQNFQANYARNSTAKPKKRHKWHYPYYLTNEFTYR